VQQSLQTERPLLHTHMRGRRSQTRALCPRGARGARHV
jgi:hypothetical protein